ncbi:MAG: hypothetical protein AB7K86_17720, partial [Rhodospirillales bacterium]
MARIFAGFGVHLMPFSGQAGERHERKDVDGWAHPLAVRLGAAPISGKRAVPGTSGASCVPETRPAMAMMDKKGVVRGLDPRIQQRGIAAQKSLLR